MKPRVLELTGRPQRKSGRPLSVPSCLHQRAGKPVRWRIFPRVSRAGARTIWARRCFHEKQNNEKNKSGKTAPKKTQKAAQKAEYQQRPDGLTAGTDEVYDSLAQNAWFPALYADEILMDDFTEGPVV